MQTDRVQPSVPGGSIPLDAVESPGLEQFVLELEVSGLNEHVNGARRTFEEIVRGETVRGDPYGFGAIRREDAARLYALVRTRRPGIVVETGVCNGVSTAYILQAMDRNDHGRLHSVDFPEVEGVDYPTGTFWSGKKGAAVPAGHAPGWVIPDALRDRWELTEGLSQHVLPSLLDRVGEIDMFIHDSEHSYECMTFELETAFPHVSNGGMLLADDARWNDAFEDFAIRHGRQMRWLTPRIACLQK